MKAEAIVHMPDQKKGVILRGHPMHFLVTREDTKHTSMFDWTIPAGFATGRHVHRVQEETFYLLEGECEWHVSDRVVAATPELTCSSLQAYHTTSQYQRKTRPCVDDGFAARP